MQPREDNAAPWHSFNAYGGGLDSASWQQRHEGPALALATGRQLSAPAAIESRATHQQNFDTLFSPIVGPIGIASSTDRRDEHAAISAETGSSADAAHIGCRAPALTAQQLPACAESAGMSGLGARPPLPSLQLHAAGAPPALPLAPGLHGTAPLADTQEAPLAAAEAPQGGTPSPVPGSPAAPLSRLPEPVKVFVRGEHTVHGTFYPDLYLAGMDCIWYDGKLVSKSRFEKEGCTTTAKWHCSIKITGQEKLNLGNWLTQHRLPVLKGANRRSRQQRELEAALQKHRASQAAAADGSGAGPSSLAPSGPGPGPDHALLSLAQSVAAAGLSAAALQAPEPLGATATTSAAAPNPLLNSPVMRAERGPGGNLLLSGMPLEPRAWLAGGFTSAGPGAGPGGEPPAPPGPGRALPLDLLSPPLPGARRPTTLASLTPMLPPGEVALQLRSPPPLPLPHPPPPPSPLQQQQQWGRASRPSASEQLHQIRSRLPLPAATLITRHSWPLDGAHVDGAPLPQQHGTTHSDSSPSVSIASAPQHPDPSFPPLPLPMVQAPLAAPQPPFTASPGHPQPTNPRPALAAPTSSHMGPPAALGMDTGAGMGPGSAYGTRAHSDAGLSSASTGAPSRSISGHLSSASSLAAGHTGGGSGPWGQAPSPQLLPPQQLGGPHRHAHVHLDLSLPPPLQLQQPSGLHPDVQLRQRERRPQQPQQQLQQRQLQPPAWLQAEADSAPSDLPTAPYAWQRIAGQDQQEQLMLPPAAPPHQQRWQQPAHLLGAVPPPMHPQRPSLHHLHPWEPATLAQPPQQLPMQRAHPGPFPRLQQQLQQAPGQGVHSLHRPVQQQTWGTPPGPRPVALAAQPQPHSSLFPERSAPPRHSALSPAEPLLQDLLRFHPPPPLPLQPALQPQPQPACSSSRPNTGGGASAGASASARAAAPAPTAADSPSLSTSCASSPAIMAPAVAPVPAHAPVPMGTGPPLLQQQWPPRPLTPASAMRQASVNPHGGNAGILIGYDGAATRLGGPAAGGDSIGFGAPAAEGPAQMEDEVFPNLDIIEGMDFEDFE